MKKLIIILLVPLIFSCEKGEPAKHEQPELEIKAELVQSKEIPFNDYTTYDLVERNSRLIGVATRSTAFTSYVDQPALYRISNLGSMDVEEIAKSNYTPGTASKYFIGQNKAFFAEFEHYYLYDLNATNSIEKVVYPNYQVEFSAYKEGLAILSLNQNETGNLRVCLMSEDGNTLDTVYSQTATSDYLPLLKVAAPFISDGQQNLALVIDNGYFNQNIRNKRLVVVDVESAAVILNEEFQLDADHHISEQLGMVREKSLFYFIGNALYRSDLQGGSFHKIELPIHPLSFSNNEMMFPVDDSRIVFRNEHKLISVNLLSESIEWEQDLPPSWILKAPLVYDNYVLQVIRDDNTREFRIAAFNVNSGRYEGDLLKVGRNTLNTSPVIIDDHLYTTSGKHIHQYKISLL